LSRLNVVGEVMVYPTGVAEVSNLDTDDVQSTGIFGFALFAC
jgi:hypothetical protein